MRTLVTAVFLLLFLNNSACGEEGERWIQYDYTKGSELTLIEKQSYSDVGNQYGLDWSPEYISTAEQIERYGRVLEPALNPKLFEFDPEDLEGITSREVSFMGRSAVIFLADDDTFFNLKMRY